MRVDLDELRQVADELDEGLYFPCDEAKVVRDAVAEIERLREAVRTICSMVLFIPEWSMTEFSIWRVAEAALHSEPPAYAVAEIERLRGACDWRPIETARRDGPAIVYDPSIVRKDFEGAWGRESPHDDPHVFIAQCENGRWTSDLVKLEYGWESTGPYTLTAELHPTNWMLTAKMHPTHWMLTVELHPTHWRPLPAPPAAP